MLYHNACVGLSGLMWVKTALSFRFAKIVIILILFQSGSCSANQGFPRVELDLKGKLYQIEIADTNERKSQGLMYRRAIGRNAGMLFPYDAPVNLNIWMKNTLIPLAVIWLDEQARVIDKKILQPCRTPDCPSFGPGQLSMYVLELHPSELDRFSIGDQLATIIDWKSIR